MASCGWNTKTFCVLVVVLVLQVFVQTRALEVKPLRCYECNVWKAGYGHLCDNPRIVSDCTVCMKIETKIFMGYYKNKPRYSVTETRICGNDNTPHFGTECLHYKSVDGYSKRCFCDTQLCNSATNRRIGTPALLMSFAATLYLTLKFIQM